MADTEETPGPATFVASFPPEERFAATAAEIAARLATACGCAPEASEDVRGAVGRAFTEVLPSAAAGRRGIEVTLRSDERAFEADVACGGQAILHCTKARTA
jgi:hypothetical protein